MVMPISVATVRDLQSAEYVKALALRERNPAKSLGLWGAARRLDPESVTLAGHEALALLENGRQEEVVALLSKILPDNPRHPHLLNLFGVALFELGHARPALRVFEHLETIDAGYPPLAQSMENARAIVGREKAAARAIVHVVDHTIGQIIERAAAKRRPTLAVCMIAKNEAEFIVGAIESVIDLADEVIVVDTGSTDETVALARAAGARVEYFGWIGDFAAARNASLSYATSDWILCLDADERLQRGCYTAVRAVMEEWGDPHRVVCVKILNFTRDRRFMSDGFSGRMFLNVPTMRFTGRVHEEVGGDRSDVATDYRLDIIFDHFGADPQIMREKSKDLRNIELLESRLKEKPDDLLTHFYLGSQHHIGGRPDAALRAFERVVELFERNPSGYSMVVRNLPVPYSYVGLVRGLLDRNAITRAVDVGNRALARFPDNVDLWYHTAFGYMFQHNLVMARRYLDRCLDTEPSGYSLIGMSNRQIKEWRALKYIGDIDFEEGDRASAYRRYSEVFKKMPEGNEERVPTIARMVELASELLDLENLPQLTLTYLELRPTEHRVGLQVALFLKERQGLQETYDFLVSAYDAVEALHDKLEWPLAIGQVAQEAGEDREALRWYEQALALGHVEPAFLRDLATLFLRLDMPSAATEVVALARATLSTRR